MTNETKPRTMIFGGLWPDGAAEISELSEFRAQERYSLARNLGGPMWIALGVVTKKRTAEKIRAAMLARIEETAKARGICARTPESYPEPVRA